MARLELLELLQLPVAVGIMRLRRMRATTLHSSRLSMIPTMCTMRLPMSMLHMCRLQRMLLHMIAMLLLQRSWANYKQAIRALQGDLYGNIRGLYRVIIRFYMAI